MRQVHTALGAALAAVVLAGVVACGGSSHERQYAVSALVSDGAVPAAHVDANLKNPWGIAFNPKGFVWVADNGTQRATLYDGNGVPQSLVVTIPPGTSGDPSPTGIVFNGTTDFVVTQGAKSGPAAFIFAGEGGTLTAWSPAVSPTAAITVFDSGGAAVYKGLAMAGNNGANFLYATDFHNNRIDVFDRTFAKVTPAGAFQDPSLPAGFAPFGIQAIGSKLFVTYAKQDAAAHDDVAGAGVGLVDVFSPSGQFLQRFATGGPLNAPWGVALAPADFGRFSHAVLVGNFGDGMLHAFDATSGMLLGTLQQGDGSAIVEPGLWGIAFGNGLNDQPANTLFFAAGPNDEADGLYGRIDVGP
ncbi:TIGR03118 family protein [Burkholderia stagnalis]|uniref:TIGR03118 family protein n=1 Tax=Burkholderia stagnalis TaxID=1503054 RepID=UPI000F570CF7|nr:TIGR03118 family protein [Burkholderia stagnalis]RQQ52343.1 TIGR03118 family protein [Burkholderia stagnalis]RQY02605.1 TIGR03118 family protein [Burkholderia stagnalis]RQY20008.1 TIGR03118 family protein [Burkholderia stagnalis]RQY31197.1 TIGR03118 family protein [Burkholderia stagnalis]